MIERDGSMVSLWQDNISKYVTRNKFHRQDVYDVIVVGGGITGISTALLLQESGKKCLVLEANTLCFGTTSGTTAHLNTVLDTPYSTIIENFGRHEAKLVAAAAREAIQLIKNNIRKYSIDCNFEETPAYLFAQDDEQTKELQEISKACHELQVKVNYTRSLPVAIGFKKILKIPKQAKFHPIRYVFALAAAFEKAGGVIIEQCRVSAADNSEHVLVRTNRGEYRSSYLLYATHIPPGVNFLDFRCAPYRSYAMAVRLKDYDYPEGLIYDMYDPYHYYRTQLIGRKKYLIAGGEDHKTGHMENTETCFLKLESHIRQHFKVKEISYRWSSQYFEPVDGLPYIGHLPGQPGNILVATGFGGNGMIYSGVSAILCKQLIFNEDDKFIKLFDPNRIKAVASFSNFVKENADSVKEWLAKLLPVDKLRQLADLAPGEARITKIDDQVVALYKDEMGSLHGVNPSCPHMKCNVVWNNAEKTWDCPCHGSRFSFEGGLLSGPANRDLEKIDFNR